MHGSSTEGDSTVQCQGKVSEVSVCADQVHGCLSSLPTCHPVPIAQSACLTLQTAQINYKSGEPVEWDDVIAAAAIAARSVTGAGNARTSSMGANLGKPGAEPPTDTVPKSQKDIVLKVRAVADNAKYNCPAAPILFRPTMMFQTRCFSFPLGNTGLAALHYNWRVLTTNHELDNTGAV